MVKKIVTDGCSFSYRNYDYENPERETSNPKCIIQDSYGRNHPNFKMESSYTEMLSKKFNIPFTNLSAPGKSMKGIILGLYRHIQQNFDSIEHTLYICGITRFKHYGFFNSDTYEQLAYNTVSSTSVSNNVYAKKRYELEREYWENINNPSVIRFEHFALLELFNSFCLANNVNILFINCYETSKLDYKLSNRFLFPNGLVCWSDYISSYCSKYQNTNHHPNLYDHTILADLLYSHLKKTYF